MSSRSTSHWRTPRHGPSPSDRSALQELSPAATPVETWGLVERLDPIPGAPHLSSGVQCVPEGFVLFNRCTACGGRSDRLFRLPPFSADPHPAERERHAAHDRVQGALARLQDRWHEEHRACPEAPRFPAPGEASSRHLVQVLAAADEALRAGKRIDRALWVCFADDTHVVLGVDQLPADAPDMVENPRAVGIALFHQSVRDRALRGGSAAQTAVLIGEGAVFVPPEPVSPMRRHGDRVLPPERLEVLVVALLTPEAGFTATPRIEAVDGGSRRLLEAGVRLRFGPMAGDEAPVFDGVLATDVDGD